MGAMTEMVMEQVEYDAAHCERCGRRHMDQCPGCGDAICRTCAVYCDACSHVLTENA